VIDPDILAAIDARAKELAAQAPPFTTEQAVLLHSLFARHCVVEV
jgi:hypothetical protein